MKYLKFLTYNWKIKLVAIIIAAGMWSYAASIQTNVAKFPSAIPISVVNLTPGYTAIFDQKDAKIEIAADSAVWQKLSVGSFTAFIDLNGFSAGTYEVPVNITTQVSDLSIISKNPNVIIVTIEPAIDKEVSIVAKIEGDAAENMIVGEVVFNPDAVRISGPESIVSGISQVTAEIVLSGESEDFSKAVKIVALDNKNQQIENISFSPGSVVANIEIVKAGNVKNVGIRVVTEGSPAEGYFVSSVSTNPAIVSISGVPNVIRTISSIPTKAINLNGSSQAITSVATLDLPVGVRIDGEINSVSVTVSISPIATTKPLTVPVNITKVPSGLSVVSVSPQSVNIIVTGQANVVESVSAGDINLSIDLSGAHSGDNYIVINSNNFSPPDGISVSSFTPQSILIKLQ